KSRRLNSRSARSGRRLNRPRRTEWRCRRRAAARASHAATTAWTSTARTGASRTDRIGRRKGIRRVVGARAASAPARSDSSRRLHLRRVDERPLVVMVAAVVQADRLILALAHDADDPARRAGAWNANW